MRRGVALLVLLSLAAAPRTAAAEGVRLRVASRQTVEGMGWLFKDPATGYCGVVTAAHVAAPKGAPGKVTIEGAHGVQGFGADVRILSPERPDRLEGDGLDVALMSVEGAIRERGCTTSTLGAADLSLVFNRPRNGAIQSVTSGGEALWLGVQFLGVNQGDPRRVSLRPARDRDHINQGYSGAAALEAPDERALGGVANPLPLALITEIDDTGDGVLAVRFDAVRALVMAALRDAGPRAGPTAAPSQLVAWDGETADLSCPGPNSVDARAACGWRARPRGDTQSVSITLAPSRGVASHVELRVEAADRQPHAITIETSQEPNGQDWIWVKTVSASAPDATLDFLPIQCRRVRISIDDKSGQTIELRAGGLR